MEFLFIHMKKLLFVIALISCQSDFEAEKTISKLEDKRQLLSDSLYYYNEIDAKAKFSIDTLTQRGKLRVDSAFIKKQQKIRTNLIPTISRLENEVISINHSIFTLSNLK